MSLPFRRASDVSRSITSAEQEMYGKLGSVSLHDLLQMLALTQRTATVKLDQASTKDPFQYQFHISRAHGQERQEHKARTKIDRHEAL